MFWFLLIALVVVVAAVTLAVVSGGEEAVLPDAEPEQPADALPAHRPVNRADLESLRLPVAVRGYRMAEVDEVLARLGAELAERDARIDALTTGGPGLRKTPAPQDRPPAHPHGGHLPGGHPFSRPDTPYAPPQDTRPDDNPYRDRTGEQPYDENPYRDRTGEQPYDENPYRDRTGEEPGR
ncbi:DivIVA domain-containing protein [Streptomyces bambusae]|uniref:DivIVA domain-containing protein n=1 Tax=Streptomyces bambusae TaxID=1550616 RepID=UPI003556A9FB